MKKQKSEPDWKQFGQFVSMVVTLFTTVRDTLDAIGVGIVEAVVWATGEGKDVFLKDFLWPLSVNIVAARSKPVLARVMVDLGAFPKKPSAEFSVEDHQGTGLVPLEKRIDGVYLDGRKIVLTQSVRQLGGKTIKGHELRDEQTGKPVLNANVLAAFLEHPELFPDDWVDAQGRPRYIDFWGTIYRRGDNLYVHCACFSVGGWVGLRSWIGDDFGGLNWAAVLEI